MNAAPTVRGQRPIGATSEERREGALRLAERVGAAAAGRTFGIPPSTIRSWRRRATQRRDDQAESKTGGSRNAPASGVPIAPAAGQTLRGRDGRFAGGPAHSSFARAAVGTREARRAELRQVATGTLLASLPEVARLLVEVALGETTVSAVQFRAISQILDRTLERPEREERGPTPEESVLLTDPGVMRLLTCLNDALFDYPDARLAVADAMRRLRDELREKGSARGTLAG